MGGGSLNFSKVNIYCFHNCKFACVHQQAKQDTLEIGSELHTSNLNCKFGLCGLGTVMFTQVKDCLINEVQY